MTDEPHIEPHATVIEAVACYEQLAQYQRALAVYEAGVRDWRHKHRYATAAANALGRGLRAEIAAIVGRA